MKVRKNSSKKLVQSIAVFGGIDQFGVIQNDLHLLTCLTQ